MRVVIMRPGQPPEVDSISDGLSGLQNVVGGWIEQAGMLSLSTKRQVVLYCNEEGKLRGLEPNFTRRDGEVIVGPVVAVRLDEHGNEIAMTLEEAADVSKQLAELR
jgi:hypothetical protein